VISKRGAVKECNRIGKKIFLFEIPKEESIDIDIFQDWWIAENLLNTLKIVFRVDGDYDTGLGHVYRAITLANKMAFNHNIFFLMDERKKLGIQKVKEYGYPVILFKNEKELFTKIDKISPNIIINDILDTDKGYIKKLKDRAYFIVNFEDLGEGSELADIVINSLYENSYPPKNHYYGYKYVCLREEFYIFPPKNVNKKVEQILVTFGGTDPNNLTLRSIRAISSLDLKNVSINIVLGLGYKKKQELLRYVNKLVSMGFKICVKENVRMMAKEMYTADIVITSNGRTVYEVAAMGVPCISIAQNEREARHLFVHHSKCIKYLGLSYNVLEDDISLALKELITNFELRKEMSNKCLQHDIKGGVERVLKLIFDKYYERGKNGN